MADTYLPQENITGLLSNIPDGVFMFDRDQKVTVVNPVATRLTGLPQEGFLIQEFTKLFKNRIKVDIDEAINNVLSTGASSHEEVPLASFFYDVFISPVRDLAGNIIGGVIVLHDITSLVEEKEKYKALLMGIGDGVVATNYEGKVLIVNQPAQDMLGYKDTELIGKELFDYFLLVGEKGNSVPREEHPIRLALLFGEKLTTTSITTAYLLLRKDKTKFPVTFTATPVILENKLLGAILVFRDITAVKILDYAKIDFISITSHELRTPLTIIRGCAERLLKLFTKKKKINQEAIELVGDIHEESIRLLRIVNEFLDITNLEEKRIQFKKESVDLIELVQATISDFKTKVQQKNLWLTLILPPVSLPLVLVDKERTRQVLLNLIANAIQYTDRGGITIAFEQSGSFVKTMVTDTGDGISLEKQRSLFQKFYTVHERFIRSREYGSGMGLYISKIIIASMGGTLGLERSEIGVGSTFSFTLPIALEEK